MTSDISGLERLTWDPTFPAPYESSWSIYNKILAYNNISFGFLVKLISNDLDGNCAGRSNRFYNSEWIDFKNFSSLLGVSPKRLKQGFLDQLGMPQVNTAAAPLMRHCPECFKKGYHSSLYNLQIFTTCPLHNLDFLSPCKSCAQQETFKLRLGRRGPGNPSRFCTWCDDELLGADELIAGVRLPHSDAKLLQRECENFVRWWKRLKEVVPQRDKVLAELTYALSLHAGPASTADSAQLSYAVSKAGFFGANWKTNLRVHPVRSFYWEGTNVIRSCSGDDCYSEVLLAGDVGRCYKSLRRWIKKSFLRKHKACCDRLKKLTDDETHRIDGGKVCSASLSYLIWRMSQETNIHRNFLDTRKSHYVRLKEPGGHKLPYWLALKFAYCEFFAIWDKIEEDRQKTNICISLVGATSAQGNVVWKKLTLEDFTSNKLMPIDAVFAIYRDPYDLSVSSDCSGWATKNYDIVLKASGPDSTLPYTSADWRAQWIFELYPSAEPKEPALYIRV